jgi:hypothetical protein
MYPYICLACNSKNEGDYPSSNICDICEWQQDAVQEDDPDYTGGANCMSLNQYRSLWQRRLQPQKRPQEAATTAV